MPTENSPQTQKSSNLFDTGEQTQDLSTTTAPRSDHGAIHRALKTPNQKTLTTGVILHLQRMYGNSFVRRLVRPNLIQRTFTHRQSNDTGDVPIEEIGEVISVLNDLAEGAGRQISFANYRTQLEAILASTNITVALDDANAAQSIDLAANAIMRQLGGVGNQLLEELDYGGNLGIQPLDDETIQYNWGGTNQLERTLRATVRNVWVTKEFVPDSPKKQIILREVGLRFVEDITGAGPRDPGAVNGFDAEGEANLLHQGTDILSSTTWMAARVDSEFTGCVGEYLARENLGVALPSRRAPTPGIEEVVLHSVRFVGNLYETLGAAQPKHQNTDVGPELDLMRIEIDHTNNDQETVVDMSNVKAVDPGSATAQARSARNQNKSAATLLGIYQMNAGRQPYGNKFAEVLRIYGKDQDGNERDLPVNSQTNLGAGRPTSPLQNPSTDQSQGQGTIGLQGQNQFTGNLPYTFPQVEALAFELWKIYSGMYGI